MVLPDQSYLSQVVVTEIHFSVFLIFKFYCVPEVVERVVSYGSKIVFVYLDDFSGFAVIYVVGVVWIWDVDLNFVSDVVFDEVFTGIGCVS